jgi:flagellar biosynthesis/type III secretory pathway protein FliH
MSQNKTKQKKHSKHSPNASYISFGICPKTKQKELDAVKQQIQIEKDEAIRDIRRQVAVLSVDIAEKVLRKSLEDKEAQMGMIDRMLDEVLTPNKN